MNETIIPSGHLRFTACVEFEVTIDEAVDVLAIVREDQRRDALAALLRTKQPVCERCYCDDALAKAVGRYCASERIDQRRMLTAPRDVATPIIEGAA